MREGRCRRCGRLRWVNAFTGGPACFRLVGPGEYCADCFDHFDLDVIADYADRQESEGCVKRTGKFPTRHGGVQPDGTGASWDNTIRAYEEDR